MYTKSSRNVTDPQDWVQHPFSEPNILNEVPERPGVYVLFGSRGIPVYMGQSHNLQRRLLEARVRGIARAYTFAFQITATAEQARRLEILIRSSVDPRFNAA